MLSWDKPDVLSEKENAVAGGNVNYRQKDRGNVLVPAEIRKNQLIKRSLFMNLKKTLSLLLAAVLLLSLTAGCTASPAPTTEPLLLDQNSTTEAADATEATEPATEAPSEEATSPSAEETTGETTEEPTEAPTEEAAQETTAPPETWEKNVLIYDFMTQLDLDREALVSVTFLDTLKDAPANAWNVGTDEEHPVLLWDGEGPFLDLTIAAEGGIHAGASLAGLFSGCIYLEYVRFNGALHTDYVTSMASLFRDCKSLYSVDMENLSTARVTDMSRMFLNCNNLVWVDVSKFQTGSVTSMREMFRGTCLRTFDISHFDTSRVTTMYCMFSTCPQLEELILGDLDTSRVENMAYMFSACQALKTLDVSGLDTGKVWNMEGMFRWCASLESLDLSNWDFSSVTNNAGFADDTNAEITYPAS